MRIRTAANPLIESKSRQLMTGYEYGNTVIIHYIRYKKNKLGNYPYVIIFLPG